MARGKFIPQGDSGVVVHQGFSAEHFGGEAGVWRTRVRADTAFGAIAGGANLALGVKALTLPAGAVIVQGCHMSLALQQTEDNVTADTPDLGIGTTVASGAVNVLGGTGAFENILTGQTAADCDGTPTVAVVGTQLVIAASASHDVFVNVADGWASDGDAALGLVGEFTILWAKVA